MTKSKLYLGIIIVLILTNLFLLFGMLKPKPPHFDKNNPKEVVIEKLHFNKEQVVKYDVLIEENRSKITAFDNTILELKKDLYAHLPQENNQKLVDSLVAQLGKEQEKIEAFHYQHFLDIKAICEPNQLADFNKLTTEIQEIFQPKKGMPERPKK